MPALDNNPSLSHQRGFSLIEILIVLAILGLLASILIVNFEKIFSGAEEQVAKSFVSQTMKTPLLKYKIDNGAYPSTQEGLAALLQQPENEKKWKGPYIEELPDDPWGKSYQYRFPGSKKPDSYDLWSWGPDGVESSDDIGNWK